MPASTNWIHQFRWEIRGPHLVRKTSDARESYPVLLKDERWARIGKPNVPDILRLRVGDSSALVLLHGATGIWLLTEANLRLLYPSEPVRPVIGSTFNPKGLGRPGKEALVNDPTMHLNLWDALDEDRDGIICASELVWFDLNGNGKIDNAEADAFSRVAASRACELVIRFDWNRDGFLDGDERGAMNRVMPDLNRSFFGTPASRGGLGDPFISAGLTRRPQETRVEVLARDIHFALLFNAVTPSPSSSERTPGRGYPTIMSQTNPNQPIDEFQRGWFLNAMNRPRPDTQPMADARAARLSPGKQ